MATTKTTATPTTGKPAAPHRLAKALSHPLRHRILRILIRRVASPNEIATELGEPLGNVSYHVRTLQRLECVELVRTAQKRGAVEHFYRATKRPLLGDEQWAGLLGPARHALMDHELVVDQQGWDDLTTIAAELRTRAAEVEAESAARLTRNGDTGIPARLVLMQFEAESSAPPAQRRRR